MGKGKDKGKDEVDRFVAQLEAERMRMIDYARSRSEGAGPYEVKGKGKDKGKDEPKGKGKGKDKGKDEVDAFLASLVDNGDAAGEFFLSEELEAAGRSPSRSRSPRVMFSATRFPSDRSLT